MECTQDLGFEFPHQDFRMNESDDSTEQTGSSNSSLGTSHDDESSASDSDCESSVSGPTSNQTPRNSFDGLIELQKGNKVFDLIKGRFVSRWDNQDGPCNVVSIRRNSFRSVTGQARFRAFQVFSKAVEAKNGGNPNVKYAWYAATRDEIEGILEHGFYETKNNGMYGNGVYLWPDDSPMECARKSAVDEDGLRYVLLCRVLLGRSEVVPPFSDQIRPTSPNFDSGVDNLSSPKKYIIWAAHMNTHILPEFILSFKAPANLRETVNIPESLKNPTSPWIPFPTLITAMSKFLPPSSMRLVLKLYKDQKERKISRFQLIQELRRVTGDKMLVDIIKSFRHKFVRKPSTG